MKLSLKEVCGYEIWSYVDKKNLVLFLVFVVKVNKFFFCFGFIVFFNNG